MKQFVSVLSKKLPPITTDNVRLLKPLAIMNYPDFGAFVWSRDGKCMAWSSESNIWLAKSPYYELQQILGHSGYISSLDFSPDGMHLVSGGYDHTVRLWNVTTGAEQVASWSHSDMVADVVFSMNGKYIASAGSWDQTSQLWNVQKKSIESVLKGHTDTVLSAAFSPNNLQLATAGGGDRAIYLWDINTGKLNATLQGHNDFVTGLIFNPTGELMASASHDNTVRLWNVTEKSELRSLNHQCSVQCVSFDPTGTILASADIDGTIWLWNPLNGDKLLTIDGHTKTITSIIFNPSGKLLCSGSTDGKIILWGCEVNNKI